MKLLNYKYKGKRLYYYISRKSKLDEMFDVVFNVRRKLVKVYKFEGKEIMMEKYNIFYVFWL